MVIPKLSIDDLSTWMRHGQAWSHSPDQYTPWFKSFRPLPLEVKPASWRGFLDPKLDLALTITQKGYLCLASDFVVRKRDVVGQQPSYAVSRLLVHAEKHKDAVDLIIRPGRNVLEEKDSLYSVDGPYVFREDRLSATFRTVGAAEQAARHANELRPSDLASQRFYAYLTAKAGSYLTVRNDLGSPLAVSGGSSYTAVVKVPSLTFFGWVVLRLSGFANVTSDRAAKWDAAWSTAKNTVKTVVFRLLWGTNGKKTPKTA